MAAVAPRSASPSSSAVYGLLQLAAECPLPRHHHHHQFGGPVVTGMADEDAMVLDTPAPSSSGVAARPRERDQSADRMAIDHHDGPTAMAQDGPAPAHAGWTTGTAGRFDGGARHKAAVIEEAPFRLPPLPTPPPSSHSSPFRRPSPSSSSSSSASPPSSSSPSFSPLFFQQSGPPPASSSRPLPPLPSSEQPAAHQRSRRRSDPSLASSVVFTPCPSPSRLGPVVAPSACPPEPSPSSAHRRRRQRRSSHPPTLHPASSLRFPDIVTASSACRPVVTDADCTFIDADDFAHFASAAAAASSSSLAERPLSPSSYASSSSGSAGSSFRSSGDDDETPSSGSTSASSVRPPSSSSSSQKSAGFRPVVRPSPLLLHHHPKQQLQLHQLQQQQLQLQQEQQQRERQRPPFDHREPYKHSSDPFSPENAPELEDPEAAVFPLAIHEDDPDVWRFPIGSLPPNEDMVKSSSTANSAPNQNLVGHCIDNGRLELVSILGLGAYGVVYLARDLTSRDGDEPALYAVKALTKVGLDARQRSFQRREIALHSLASAHPAVVTLHSVIETPSCIFVVLDYCPDGDLFGMITEQQRYLGNEDRIRSVLLQIIGAVEHCHRLGIAHRDLKPENILCKRQGDEVVLADFGLATAERTSGDFGCGSTFYMSPECQGGIFERLGSYSTMHNDVWSLGVILVNLTCGRNPWKQACPTDETFRAYLQNPDFLRSILPVSRPCNDLLKRIFALNPLSRISLAELRSEVVRMPAFTMTNDELRTATKATREAARAWQDVPSPRVAQTGDATPGAAPADDAAARRAARRERKAEATARRGAAKQAARDEDVKRAKERRRQEGKDYDFYAAPIRFEESGSSQEVDGIDEKRSSQSSAGSSLATEFDPLASRDPFADWSEEEEGGAGGPAGGGAVEEEMDVSPSPTPTPRSKQAPTFGHHHHHHHHADEQQPLTSAFSSASISEEDAAAAAAAAAAKASHNRTPTPQQQTPRSAAKAPSTPTRRPVPTPISLVDASGRPRHAQVVFPPTPSTPTHPHRARTDGLFIVPQAEASPSTPSSSAAGKREAPTPAEVAMMQDHREQRRRRKRPDQAPSSSSATSTAPSSSSPSSSSSSEAFVDPNGYPISPVSPVRHYQAVRKPLAGPGGDLQEGEDRRRHRITPVIDYVAPAFEAGGDGSVSSMEDDATEAGWRRRRAFFKQQQEISRTRRVAV